jgi:Carboxypeptidase regulatory-like domain
MKILAIIVLVLGYCISASTYCVTVIDPETKSFQNARITVLHEEKPQEGVKLIVQPPDGRDSRSFLTDSHGTAMLKDLPAGTNCVRAIGEDHLGAYLCLAVSKDPSPEISAFVLTLADVDPPPPLGSGPADVLRKLEMVVQDPSGAAIPHSEIWVYARQLYPKNPLVKALTDQDGRVVVPVNPGTYAVTVRSPGFKAAVHVIEVSPNGRVDPIREVLQVGSC